MGRQVFGTRMVCRETFLQIQRRLLQHLIRKSPNPWVSNVSEHTSPHVMSESQTPAQDQRCNSFVPSEGRFSKNYGADQQRLQISDPHFSNVRLLEDKIQDLGMYLLTISYGSYAVDQRSGDG